jgi:hypothetical protein
MADNTTGLPVQTISGQFVSTKLVDSGGTNVAAVDASGRVSTNIGSIGGSVPSATNPLYVELSTGAAAYTLFGQAIGSAPWTRITDGTTTAGVIAGTTALKTDISSIAGTAPGATSVLPTRLSDGSAFYTNTGQAVGTAAYSRITDGSLTASVRDTGTNDSLNVSIVDASGNQIVSFGGGTQYAGDAAATSTPTGTVAMGLANAAAPADVSANNDAVAQWMLRNGSAVTNLASGGTLITIGQKTAANGLPVTLASDQATATAPLHVILGTGAADYTLFGQAAATAPFTRITDATNSVSVIATINSLKTDLSSIAGVVPGATSFVPARLTDGSAYYTRYGQAAATGVYSVITDGTLTATVRDTGASDSLNVAIVDGSGNQITSFGGGTQYAGDAAATSTPTGTMSIGLANSAAPADVSANNDAVAQWMLRNGSAVNNLAVGGTLITNLGQAAANGMYMRITDATNSAAVRATVNSLNVDITSVGGTAISQTVPVSVRMTDGTNYYTRTGQSGATGVYSTINDGTTTAGVIVATTALKTDLSSVAGTATVTGGIAGVQAVGGPVAHDGVISTNNPLIMGARASAAAPTNVSADNDVTTLWALQNGSQVVNIAAGGTLWTNMGQAAASGQFVRITDATNTAAVIATINSLKTDFSSIAGVVPGATSFVPARLTDGSAYYTNTGQTAGTSVFSRINDGTTTAGVIVSTTALKVDLASIIGSVPGATNPVPVRITDGAAFYSAASSAPTDPKYSTQTSAALGAGSNVRLNHYVTSGKTGQLIGIDSGSTVPCKVEIQTILTGTPTTRVVLFTKPYEVYQWRAPFKTFITRASADATSGFSVTITNKDASVAADVYSTGYWDEV